MRSSTTTVLLLLARALAARAAVVVSEVADRGDGHTCGAGDWVELYNDGGASVDLTGYARPPRPQHTGSSEGARRGVGAVSSERAVWRQRGPARKTKDRAG